MRVLVTGGAGFIGSHLTAELLRRGDEVVVLDNFETGSEENLAGLGPAERLRVLKGDVREEAAVERALRALPAGPVEAVSHQAALPSVERSVRDPAATLRTNVVGTALVLEAARRSGVGRFVYASSSSVYGDTEVLPKTEDMTPRPASPYAVSKLAGEQMVRLYAPLHGMASVSLRYFNVFGPRQDPDSPYAAVVPRFLAALTSGRPPEIFGDGEQTRDFTYVGNAVQANLLALAAPERAWGGVYNVGCGRRVSVAQLASLLRDAVGGPEPAHGPPRPGDVRHSLASIEAARRDLGYEPRVTLEAGLRETATSFQAG